jgi:hypothetical protein
MNPWDYRKRTRRKPTVPENTRQQDPLNLQLTPATAPTLAPSSIALPANTTTVALQSWQDGSGTLRTPSTRSHREGTALADVLELARAAAATGAEWAVIAYAAAERLVLATSEGCRLKVGPYPVEDEGRRAA